MPELTANQIPQAPSPGYRPYKVTDACRSYNLLASKDRLITYNDWSSYRCDMPLFGWYRFTDAEGIQMLNSCPVESSSSVNSCGSYYKGWLKNQVLPIQNEGIVNRTVCFSTPGKCNCSYTREIKIINCGAFYAYYLDAVPICNARYCGKEGKLRPENFAFCTPKRVMLNVSLCVSMYLEFKMIGRIFRIFATGYYRCERHLYKVQFFKLRRSL